MAETSQFCFYVNRNFIVEIMTMQDKHTKHYLFKKSPPEFYGVPVKFFDKYSFFYSFKDCFDTADTESKISTKIESALISI